MRERARSMRRGDDVAPPHEERYTPGRSAAAVAHMTGRRLETHGRFFLPHLHPGHTVLDVGCGPGTITVGLASAVAPGSVLGVDAEGDQFELGRQLAARAGISNISFEVASCYNLPRPDGSFARVFSHALLEHLAEPVTALREAHRVLRPGGVIGVCSPDWAAALLSPPSPAIEAAVRAFQQLQRANGGDPLTGRQLGMHLHQAGFDQVRLDARYERYTRPAEIAELLALLLDGAGQHDHARNVRSWAEQTEGAMFAEAWVSATAVRPA